MRFTDEQIDLARQLKRRGMPWSPQVGHYVFDAKRICPKTSPFQSGVYFLLNFDCFMDHVGGLKRFREKMVWLPTWHDAREALAAAGVDGIRLAKLIGQSRQAVTAEQELTRLYELMLEHCTGELSTGVASQRPAAT